ncbi:5671_t:CDS:2, partial [Funneliformis caledonium]
EAYHGKNVTFPIRKFIIMIKCVTDNQQIMLVTRGYYTRYGQKPLKFAKDPGAMACNIR